MVKRKLTGGDKAIVQACDYNSQSCLNFNSVNNLVIKMVSDYYIELQMYANFVVSIDNDAKNYNILQRVAEVSTEYGKKYPELFSNDRMRSLEAIIKEILLKIKSNEINAQKYMGDLENITIFGMGALSSTILLKADRKVDFNLMPLIIKLMPLELKYHEDYIYKMNKGKEVIELYINTPNNGLFIKEAWMYCFSKNVLSKYTPTFTCIANCYIIKGLPVQSLDSLSKIYYQYARTRQQNGKTVPYKKWLEILMDPETDNKLKKAIYESSYGCFEMRQIDGTLEELVTKYTKPNFDLGMIFEYLYTKIVAAFIAKIIFTDDHFENIAFTKVNYSRHYTIKCNGCNYNFYIRSPLMIQFIDLERYVFNYSPYDIYTNDALKKIPEKDLGVTSSNLNRVKQDYIKNSNIYDKSIYAFLNKVQKNDFIDGTEYDTMMKILQSAFIYDIKTFCQIMETNLPATYTKKPDNNTPYHQYFIDLDDDKSRVITTQMVKSQIN